MSYKPGNAFYVQVVSSSSNNLVNTDIMPWATLVRNGLDDATVPIFVTHVDLGRYTVSGTIPHSYNTNDVVGIVVSGLTNNTLLKATSEIGILDSPVPNVNVISVSGMPATPIVGAINAILTSHGLDNVMIEQNVTAKQALTEIAAALCGVMSSSGSLTLYQGINNPGRNRMTVGGNRKIINYSMP